MQVQIEQSWKEILEEDFSKPYFNNLVQFVKQEYAQYTCFPKGKNIFAAFEYCPLDSLKVVLLGQDPYHGLGQAHGLSFSVPKGIKIPPSLQNIYKELHSDIGMEIPNHGNLTHWAQQGVLLLNATLTVRAHQAGSHQQQGWETFTDEVIRKISNKKENVVFLLWGKFAQQKEDLIDTQKHLVLKAAHPSPFSAHRGFLGCKHFSKTNIYLQEYGIDNIDWHLT